MFFIKLKFLYNITYNIFLKVFVSNKKIICNTKLKYVESFGDNKNNKETTKYLNFVTVLKYLLCFEYSYLNDLVIIDEIYKQCEIERIERFKINYVLSSVYNNTKLLLNIPWEIKLKIYSSQNLYSSITWLEREAWDLFGVFFEGSKDLRRILTDYGFNGFPFRCDFPIVGYLELEYNEETQDINYRKLSMAQENRYFDFAFNWRSG